MKVLFGFLLNSSKPFTSTVQLEKKEDQLTDIWVYFQYKSKKKCSSNLLSLDDLRIS